MEYVILEDGVTLCMALRRLSSFGLIVIPVVLLWGSESSAVVLFVISQYSFGELLGANADIRGNNRIGLENEGTVLWMA